MTLSVINFGVSVSKRFTAILNSADRPLHEDYFAPISRLDIRLSCAHERIKDPIADEAKHPDEALG